MKIIKKLEEKGCQVDNEIIWELVRLAYGNFYKGIVKDGLRSYVDMQIKVQFNSRRNFCEKTGIKYHVLLHFLTYKGKSAIKPEIIQIANALSINLKHWI